MDTTMTKETPLSGWPTGQTTTDFSWAITQLKTGKTVCRTGWNGKGMWIGLQSPDNNSLMTLPYIYMRTADNNLVPWLASQTDMLANDWMLTPTTTN